MVKTLLSEALFGAAHMAGFSASAFVIILNSLWVCVRGGVELGEVALLPPPGDGQTQ